MITGRLAVPDRDAARVSEIYRPHVVEGLASFEEVPPTADEMAARMRKTLDWTPWLVAEEDGEVIGYAYASRHRDRAGYRWSVDISVYVDARWHRRGVGRLLYTVLLPVLKQQGFVNIFAGITTPNPGSVALHESIGMKLIGAYEGVGYKHGQWLDVAWYGMRLQDPGEPPAEPIPFPAIGTLGVPAP